LADAVTAALVGRMDRLHNARNMDCLRRGGPSIAVARRERHCRGLVALTSRYAGHNAAVRVELQTFGELRRRSLPVLLDELPVENALSFDRGEGNLFPQHERGSVEFMVGPRRPHLPEVATAARHHLVDRVRRVTIREEVKTRAQVLDKPPACAARQTLFEREGSACVRTPPHTQPETGKTCN